jgi:hypothetical protein
VFFVSAVFDVAPGGHPSYRRRLMGQQLRRTVKRRRRTDYLERKKVKAKEAAASRPAAKTKAKKTAAPAPAPAAAAPAAAATE